MSLRPPFLLTFAPSSAYVRKTTALAIPKLVSLDQVRQQEHRSSARYGGDGEEELEEEEEGEEEDGCLHETTAPYRRRA